jgi:methylornithine synthase
MNQSLNLKKILDRAEQNIPLSKQDMVSILETQQPEEVQSIFKAARNLREKYFGNRIFLYGFLYFSTYCRNSCNFCLYRKTNTEAPRYRKTATEIIESSKRLADSGVNLIDLTMGEDPLIFKKDHRGFDTLLDIIRSVKEATQLPVMISAGVLPEMIIKQLSEAGASWYACYQETHNQGLYNSLRTSQDYDLRFNSKRQAKEQKLLIEEGLLSGIGESSADIANSIFAMQELNADQVRVMALVPQKGTPMAEVQAPDPSRELLITALMRLALPDRLIPASLDVGGHAELDHRLAAGANVVTSLIPPGQGLAGVAQSSLDIEDGKRTVAGIKDVLSENDLVAATNKQYESWLTQQIKKIPSSNPKIA